MHKSRNVLVTGGAGFIGSNFIRYLLDVDSEVKILNLDLLTYAGNLNNLRDLPRPEHHKFVRGDISDYSLVKELIQKYQIDTIVNFAAETHVDRSIMSPASFIHTNIVGTFTLLEAARSIWLREPKKPVRFHHISTDEVFGSLNPESPSFSETMAYEPNSPYAASKASSDHLVRAYFRTYQLPITISNCSNNYGPYQFPEKLIPLMLVNGIAGKTLPVYGDGQQIRDWLFVYDHCEAIHMILRKGDHGETYNIGGNNQLSNLFLVEQICDLLDEFQPLASGTTRRQLIQFVNDRPGHDRRYAINISKIQSNLGWSPRYSFYEGLRATTKWYLSNMKWISAISQSSGYQEWLESNYSHRSVK